MAGRQCYHCKQWIEEGEPHDCWTTTEAALTQDLSEDLRDAWDRLRESAAEFGEQRIYASHKSIMFARKSCYFFVRPKKSHLEVCVFLPRAIKAPQVRRIEPASKSKLVHFLRVQHRDEVEAPITDWLQEAYELAGAPAVSSRRGTSSPGPPDTPAALTRDATDSQPLRLARPAEPERTPRKKATRKTPTKSSTRRKRGSRRSTARKSRS